MDINELKELQAMPTEWKVIITKARIRDAITHFGIEGIYLSFSGGKDSTVLHHILKEVELEDYGKMMIPRVFANTGLEYPELVQHVKDTMKGHEELMVFLKPKKNFIEILSKYGYPVVSKEQSRFLHEIRTTKSEKLYNLRFYGKNGTRSGMISNKWKYLINADFKISDNCCHYMKKEPFKRYNKETGRFPIVGVMTEESRTRLRMYLANGGCNAFHGKNAQSQPIGFWTEQDIYKYIKENNIKIPSVYGEIIEEDGKLRTTGTNRTGCMFCVYGVHMEKGKNKFQKMKETHPKLYNYCINGGKYDENGNWAPHGGLGLGKVLDDLNIKYD